MSAQTPRDLANFVYGRLDRSPRRPSVNVLELVFSTLFLASLSTEEGNPVRCTIALIDERGPDPDPPILIRDNRWTYTPLKKLLNLTVGDLTKLALATDPASSALAIGADKYGNLTIRGIFDQQGVLNTWPSHENDTRYGPPGIIQARVLGIGHIFVTDDFEVIAEFNRGLLIENSVDVFSEGLVKRRLEQGFNRRIENIFDQVANEGYEPEENFGGISFEDWSNILKRILLRARDIGHGGAILITSKPLNKYLDIKYGFNYNRIPQLFEKWAYSQIIRGFARHEIRELMENNKNGIEPSLYCEEAIAEDELEDSEDALNGSIGLIAALCNVDGLVILDTDFGVQGFGCEILVKDDANVQPYFANHARPTAAKVSKLNMKNFGTRHRSMIRYCTKDNNAVGFVISSDGPIRAIAHIGKRTYFWSNIQLGVTR